MNTARSWTFDNIAMPLAVVALAILANASPPLAAAWELDRAAVTAGEWTRLVTGHLTHWNADHLSWDAATFFALSVVCLRRRPLLTLACLLFSTFAISATFLAAHQDLPTYRGLSGLDTALFTFLAVSIYQDARAAGDRALGAVAKWALAGLVAKTAYELVTGDTLFVDSDAAGFVPLATVHAVGAAVGLITAVLPPCITTLRSRNRESFLVLPAECSRPCTTAGSSSSVNWVHVTHFRQAGRVTRKPRAL